VADDQLPKFSEQEKREKEAQIWALQLLKDSNGSGLATNFGGGSQSQSASAGTPTL